MSVIMAESTGVPARRAESPGEIGQVEELLGVAEPGQDAGQGACRPIQPLRTASMKAALSAAPAWRKIGLDGPGLLDVPLEAGARRDSRPSFRRARSPRGYTASGSSRRRPGGRNSRCRRGSGGGARSPGGTTGRTTSVPATDRPVVHGDFDGDAPLLCRPRAPGNPRRCSPSRGRGWRCSTSAAGHDGLGRRGDVADLDPDDLAERARPRGRGPVRSGPRRRGAGRRGRP